MTPIFLLCQNLPDFDLLTSIVVLTGPGIGLWLLSSSWTNENSHLLPSGSVSTFLPRNLAFPGIDLYMTLPRFFRPFIASGILSLLKISWLLDLALINLLVGFYLLRDIFFSWFYILLSSGHQFLHILCLLTLVGLTLYSNFYIDSFSAVFRALPLTVKPIPNWWWPASLQVPGSCRHTDLIFWLPPQHYTAVWVQKKVARDVLSAFFFSMVRLWSCLSGLSSLSYQTHTF